MSRYRSIDGFNKSSNKMDFEIIGDGRGAWDGWQCLVRLQKIVSYRICIKFFSINPPAKYRNSKIGVKYCFCLSKLFLYVIHIIHQGMAEKSCKFYVILKSIHGKSRSISVCCTWTNYYNSKCITIIVNIIGKINSMLVI